MLHSGERQVAPVIEGIRRDHVARYEWASRRAAAGLSVIDCACGVGYGSAILAGRADAVFAFDRDADAIGYARRYYGGNGRIHYEVNAADGSIYLPEAEAAVAFEIIEHLEDPRPLLRHLREKCQLLFASVPNEKVFPFIGYKFHFRHYTREEFAALLAECGWQVDEWWGQVGPESEVERDVEGRTLIVKASALGKLEFAAPVDIKPQATHPKHIAIVAFGSTNPFYVDAAKKYGSRRRFADLVIGVNTMGSIIQCDVVVHMDDIRIQERRAAADPEGQIAAMVEWLREYQGRVITSRSHPDYPHLEEFPLEDILNEFQGGYINGSGAAALAWAIYQNPEEISLWGFDFTYPNSHKNEKGRACVEYWMGRAHERGIIFRLPPKTSLMDSFEDSASDEARFYGYDTMRVTVSAVQERENEPIRFKVTKTPLPESEWPTAEQVEAAYDHGKHPNDQGRAK